MKMSCHASSSSSLTTFTALAFFLLLFPSGSSSAKLSINFYSKTCPNVLNTVRSVVHSAVSKEHRIGASLLRLHFHDCFVNGCDGSILLDDSSSFIGEKTAAPNNRSLRAIAARDSTEILGGPSWKVTLGRRDSKTASFSDANSGVIPPPTSTLNNLINRFKTKGLSAKDMVALSGAHTIGRARCTVFRTRIYNETNIDGAFAKTRQKNCPRTSGSGDDNIAPLDVSTRDFFDNKYYKNLLNKKGLLHSDQILFNGGSTDSLVRTYSRNDKTFDSDFTTAMIKMGNIQPLTGSKGEIRKNCRKPN
ncbi:Peroxidase [Quillaja saponaria]|uniref:Peroxidase n=1 Tax=Quillaja saponaria TaxID=32244 RepID=A0AAD7LL26_QUISA|nr:Peroxidase [Quillaja saponaria]